MCDLESMFHLWTTVSRIKPHSPLLQNLMGLLPDVRALLTIEMLGTSGPSVKKSSLS